MEQCKKLYTTLPDRVFEISTDLTGLYNFLNTNYQSTFDFISHIEDICKCFPTRILFEAMFMICKAKGFDINPLKDKIKSSTSTIEIALDLNAFLSAEYVHKNTGAPMHSNCSDLCAELCQKANYPIPSSVFDYCLNNYSRDRLASTICNEQDFLKVMSVSVECLSTNEVGVFYDLMCYLARRQDIVLPIDKEKILSDCKTVKVAAIALQSEIMKARNKV